MAGEKTQVEIDAQIDAGIKVNGNKEITPPIHNAIEKALSNSYVNKIDSGLVLQALLGYTTDLIPSNDKHLTPKKYVDDLIDAEILSFAGTLDSIYYRLDGTLPLAGDMDADGFNIENAGVITALDGLSTDGVPSIFSDTTNNRIYMGMGAGAAATGTDQFFAGDGAGAAAGGNNLFGAGTGVLEGSTGNNKNAYGFQALRASTNSNMNAMGVSAGGNSTADDGNYFGNSAGFGSSGGNCNFSGSSAGLNNTGARCNGFGFEALNGNTADDVVGIGFYAGKNNTTASLYTVAGITQVFWNNVGDKGNTTLGNVTVQAAMAPDGTNQNAGASVQRFAASRGTGTGTAGDLQWMYSVPEASGTTRQSLALAASMAGATGIFTFEKGVTMADVANISFNTGTGTKIGTATGQKLAFWNAAPIAQPTTAIAAATFVANTSAIADDTATFDGYTIGQITKALRNAGILA